MSRTAAKSKGKEKQPTEKELLDQMRIDKIGTYYRAEQSYWEHHFCVEFFGFEFRFPIIVQDSVAEADRDRVAKELFKDTVALIAKKVAAY